ncbi:TPA: excinuclease ABC subunit UvrC [Candidatus Micrarchaeota archaeon]|nr:excinuclease ABC subunit UvrC [Candidatus Micrarchaeota archaeon]HIH30955.1 excinuclease ABC subunit UvrC [Candidatus Micrarchaeota archaeon]
MLQDIARSAPRSPGVYIFKDKAGSILYIGKAKDIRNRIANYFGKGLLDRTGQMVSNASSLEFIVTDNEAEALLLESRLIKQHFPKYNIDLKDNEKFTYILITEEEFPRMLLVRRSRGGKVKARGKLFGPFTSGSAYVLVASTLRKIFKLRTCRVGQGRPCLQFHLGFCLGPCAGLVTPEEYEKQVQKLKHVLSGGKKLEEVIGDMMSDMKKASKARQFERALVLRNSIHSLSSLLERQKIESGSEANEDYISVAMHQGKAHVQLFRQIGGVIRDRKKFEFEPLDPDPLSEFLPRFYEAGGIPRRIYVEKEPESQTAIEGYLAKKRGGPVSILVPEKGDKKKLLELLRKNILLEISGNADPAIVELQQELKLPALPRTIECFDISNLYGTSVVGSMVQFVNGKPNKSGYRRFRIRTVEGQDDFASMKEVVFRRYCRIKKEGSQLPDLVLIDGGAGQLNAALSALSELNLALPCVSLAKEFEEIYHPEFSEPLRLARSSPALKALQFARDEAHRFGIAYHRLLRKKAMKD